MIEGTCSVQCSGPNTLVCDTGVWDYEANPLSNSAQLDVKVLIADSKKYNGYTTVVLEGAFKYYGEGRACNNA